jgi:predicted dehydrogenase
MKRLRWGIIGCGGIAARRTIPEVTKMDLHAEIVSVMDVAIDRAREVAERFRIPHFCGVEEGTLAQDIDAVYIASPPKYHADQTIKAATFGKHILCEKPMTLSSHDADRMLVACSKAAVKFMLGFCMRNNPYHMKARELVQSGGLGQMIMGRAQLTCWYPPDERAWRQDISLSGGGSLIDMGAHCLDLLEWIMGTKVVEVCGFQDVITHRYRTRIEDTSTTIVRFSSGAHGIIDNYFNVPDSASLNRLELYGTKGSIIGEGTVGQEATGRMFSTLQEQEQRQYETDQTRASSLGTEEYRLRGSGLYGEMIDTFSQCILNGSEPPVSIQDGLHSVRLVEGIYQSRREYRVVRVKV